LQRLIRSDWEHQKYFPLVIATKLSQQFAQHGLQFFKVNKTVTHVSVARPLFLDLETTPVSENIKRIVEFINSRPKGTRRQLIEALAPTPKAATVIEIPAPVAEGETPAKPAEAKAPEATPEQTAIIVDLHWLVHQGHVLEFADGKLETAKKPLPKPPKPEKKAAAVKPPVESEAVVVTEAAPPAEVAATAPETPVVETPVQPVTPPAAEGSVA
jgi:hypothetical protein